MIVVIMTFVVMLVWAVLAAVHRQPVSDLDELLAAVDEQIDQPTAAVHALQVA